MGVGGTVLRRVGGTVLRRVGGTVLRGRRRPRPAARRRDRPAWASAAPSRGASAAPSFVGVGGPVPRRVGGTAAGRPRLQPRDVPRVEARAATDDGTPADALRAARIGHGARVEPQPGDLHVDVTPVRVDRDPPAVALHGPAGVRAADHGARLQAGADQGVADGAGAVVARVEEPGVAAAPLVGLADDEVRRGDDALDPLGRGARDRGAAVRAQAGDATRDGPARARHGHEDRGIDGRGGGRRRGRALRGGAAVVAVVRVAGSRAVRTGRTGHVGGDVGGTGAAGRVVRVDRGDGGGGRAATRGSAWCGVRGGGEEEGGGEQGGEDREASSHTRSIGTGRASPDPVGRSTGGRPVDGRCGRVQGTAPVVPAHRPVPRRRPAPDPALDELVGLTLELAAIPAPTGHEEERGDAVARLFSAAGLVVERDAVGNVLARPSGADREAPAVVVAGHLDTVFGPEVALRPRRDGDRLLAPGIGDNTVAVAALVVLARELAAGTLAPGGGVVLAATVGEEGLGDLRGAKHLLRTVPARAFISLEGHLLDELVVGGIGSVRLRASYAGPGGHSWGDRDAPSAVHAMLEAGAAALRAVPAGRHANFGVASGGTTVNAIAGT
ncbi:MAG: M20/M25/M40 family metallo-hydrolase, partial [Actinobacteria bacterium]|nr:M20/M25/M40 family metallo-hydrolase [Actinomycetota bacterium]